jgi:hypothetical protein
VVDLEVAVVVVEEGIVRDGEGAVCWSYGNDCSPGFNTGGG